MTAQLTHPKLSDQADRRYTEPPRSAGTGTDHPELTSTRETAQCCKGRSRHPTGVQDTNLLSDST
ncbi:hypothetical protein AAMO2058_001495600 [Amorphochlora amoebiformis]